MNNKLYKTNLTYASRTLDDLNLAINQLFNDNYEVTIHDLKETCKKYFSKIITYMNRIKDFYYYVSGPRLIIEDCQLDFYQLLDRFSGAGSDLHFKMYIMVKQFKEEIQETYGRIETIEYYQKKVKSGKY